jgi:uncharacterized membrane protein
MASQRATPERLAAFSDGVLAIIITIMVLDLRVPHEVSLATLCGIWPTFASYALSYLFVGLLWINHHHLLRYAETADARVIWSNLGLLFFVSLIPFFTSLMAENHMNALTTALYAFIFLLVTVSFSLFQAAVTRQAGHAEEVRCMFSVARKRNWIAMALYILAIPSAYVRPAISFALIFGVALLYSAPNAARHEA